MADAKFPPRIFDRRYVLVPVLAVVVLIATNYFVSEERRAYVTDLSRQIQASQEKISQLGDLIYSCADAESAQRGFLLTDRDEYLAPFDVAKAEAYAVVDRLLADVDPLKPAERQELVDIRNYMDKKFSEMQITIDVAKKIAGNQRAISILKTDVGLEWMQGLRKLVTMIQARERANTSADIELWTRQINVNRAMSAVATALNLLLVVLVGVLISREIGRRQTYSAELAEEVKVRTRELSELSQHLQTVQEVEKAGLARELHDELGGLLVAIKMDLSQIAKQLDIAKPGVHERWQRIQAALTSGIELKRRVIEELRPTLLDNMGLFEALRWHVGQSCERAGIALQAHFPDREAEIPEAVAIAVFRVVQESLTNIAKHASAQKVVFDASALEQGYQIVIRDDGVGLPPDQGSRTGTHGLSGMKYRMLAIGGSIEIGPAVPHGVITTLTFPRSRPPVS